MGLYRKTVALALLAFYTALVITIDLHHNHSVHLPGSVTPSIAAASGELQPISHHHDPCPVLLFSLAHALSSAITVSSERGQVSTFLAVTDSCATRFFLTPSERAPPLA